MKWLNTFLKDCKKLADVNRWFKGKYWYLKLVVLAIVLVVGIGFVRKPATVVAKAV